MTEVFKTGNTDDRTVNNKTDALLVASQDGHREIRVERITFGLSTALLSKI
jgi:hypothetical protein